MKRFLVRLFDAPFTAWLYIIAGFILLHAADNAHHKVLLGKGWMVYGAPAGIALAAVAAFAAGLQHNKLQLLVVTAVCAFIGTDTPNPVRFPGLQASHVLYTIAAASAVFLLLCGEREWAGTNWLRVRAKRVVPAACLALGVTMPLLYRNSLTGSAILAACIAGLIVWYNRAPSEYDYRGELPRAALR
jgi:hypothetical protein